MPHDPRHRRDGQNPYALAPQKELPRESLFFSPGRTGTDLSSGLATLAEGLKALEGPLREHVEKKKQTAQATFLREFELGNVQDVAAFVGEHPEFKQYTGLLQRAHGELVGEQAVSEFRTLAHQTLSEEGLLSAPEPEVQARLRDLQNTFVTTKGWQEDGHELTGFLPKATQFIADTAGVAEDRRFKVMESETLSLLFTGAREIGDTAVPKGNHEAFVEALVSNKRHGQRIGFTTDQMDERVAALAIEQAALNPDQAIMLLSTVIETPGVVQSPNVRAKLAAQLASAVTGENERAAAAIRELKLREEAEFKSAMGEAVLRLSKVKTPEEQQSLLVQMMDGEVLETIPAAHRTDWVRLLSAYKDQQSNVLGSDEGDIYTPAFVEAKALVAQSRDIFYGNVMDIARNRGFNSRQTNELLMTVQRRLRENPAENHPVIRTALKDLDSRLKVSVFEGDGGAMADFFGDANTALRRNVAQNQAKLAIQNAARGAVAELLEAYPAILQDRVQLNQAMTQITEHAAAEWAQVQETMIAEQQRFDADVKQMMQVSAEQAEAAATPESGEELTARLKKEAATKITLSQQVNARIVEQGQKAGRSIYNKVHTFLNRPKIREDAIDYWRKAAEAGIAIEAFVPEAAKAWYGPIWEARVVEDAAAAGIADAAASAYLGAAELPLPEPTPAAPAAPPAQPEEPLFGTGLDIQLP